MGREKLERNHREIAKPAAAQSIHQPAVVGSRKTAVKVLLWTHTLIANAKGNIRGVCDGVRPKHLRCYLSEFSYRFSR
jgi:hypothetical protein